MARREDMLAQIRKALGRPTEVPAPSPRAHAAPFEMGDLMPAVAAADLLLKFETELEKVGGSPHRVATLNELEKVLQPILEASQATSVVLSRNPLLARLGLAARLRALGTSAEAWPAASGVPLSEEEKNAFRERCFSATVGFTGVDFALAETGSLVLSSQTEGSQLTSLAPPVHLAFYRRSQLIGSLDEALEKLPIPRDPNLPLLGRSVVLITGPSRTADIEQILIRGVHGPREVHAVLVEESCLA